MKNSFYIIDNHLRIKSDIGAKRTFANPKYKANTIHLIEDFLGIKPKDIHFIQPYRPETLIKETGSSPSETEVDILVDVDDDKQIIIELQLRNHPYFMERILHYQTSRYADNYGKDSQQEIQGFGKYYKSLIPVYTLCIIDFIAFPADDAYLHKFELYDRENKFYYLGEKHEQLLQISILELAKIGQNTDNIVRNWASLFRNNRVDDSAPDYLKEIIKATEIFSMAEEEVAMISEKERIERHNQMHWEELVLAGERRGLEQGIEQGIIRIARNLLRQEYSLDEVQKITGLEIDKIKQLRIDN